MNRIEKLTPDQLTLLPQQRDKWIKAGLSTEPANRQRAEEGVRKAYRAAGLEPPRVIIWLDSPLAGAYGQALIAESAGWIWVYRSFCILEPWEGMQEVPRSCTGTGSGCGHGTACGCRRT